MSTLLERFISVRKYSENLCEPLEIEDYTPQSAVFASPPKWHLAHTTWFFEEFILNQHVDKYQLFDADFSFLFNSYYNNVGDRILRSNRGLLTRPSVEKVYQYRKHVDEQLLRNKNLFDDSNVSVLIELGLNHEEQHQELLITDLKYTLSQNPIHPVYQEGFNLIGGETNGNSEWRTIEAGLFDIGYQGNGFCYDNELGAHQVHLPEFQISERLVSVADYLEFIKDGGYQKFGLWLDEGWAWVQQNQVNSPLYWKEGKNGWMNYTLSGLQEVDLNAPIAHVNFYEANAFASWSGYRLLTEFEWEAAADLINWGERWEWTNSAYLPYPNYVQEEGALGEYNGKFMVNQMVLRGGSCATPKDHFRLSYRNFFHPYLRWQYTTIRLAK